MINNIYYKPLTGRYFIQISYGSICLDLDSEEPELWLQNQYGTFKIAPYVENHVSQLCFEFDNDFLIEKAALEYKKIWVKTLQYIDIFNSQKQAIATFSLCYGKPALELIDDCPGLAFLMATEYFYQFGDERRATGCLLSPERKRTEILASYGYIGSKSVAKIFRKISAAECCGEFFHDFRNLLCRQNKGVMKALRHVKRINHLLVKILSIVELLPYLKNSLIEEVSVTSREEELSQYYYQIVELRETLVAGIARGRNVAPLRRIKDLDALHSVLIDWLRDNESSCRLENIKFPPPPLQGVDRSNDSLYPVRITPIQSGSDLWQEGKRMHHCIAAYAYAIQDGEGCFYAYHLELPDGEIATMLIGSWLDKWAITQIRGVCNAKVSEQMQKSAERWLVKQQSIFEVKPEFIYKKAIKYL